MIKKILPLVILIFLPSFVYSQEKDFGIWYSLNAKIGLIDKLSLDLSGNLRTFNKATEIEESFGEVGLTYKILKNLSLDGSYRLTDKLEDDSEYHLRHKWISDLKGTFDVGDFELSGRLRFQRQVKTFIEDANDKIPDHYGRIKLKTIYKTPSFPINPFLAFETFSRLFETEEKRFEKYRLSIGLEYQINNKNSIEAGYIFQRDYLPHLSEINIIALSYNIKL